MSIHIFVFKDRFIESHAVDNGSSGGVTVTITDNYSRESMSAPLTTDKARMLGEALIDIANGADRFQQNKREGMLSA